MDLPPIPPHAAPPIRAQFQPVWDNARGHPGDAAALGQLGMLFAAYQENGAAAGLFDRARRLAPAEFQWHYYAAVIDTATGHNTQAIEGLRRALQIRPGDGPALLRLGKLTQDVALLRRAVAANPRSALALYDLGKATNDIDSLNAAVALAPDFGSAHFALARLLQQAGRASEAQQHFQLHALHRAHQPVAGDPLLQLLDDLDLSAPAEARRGYELLNANRFPEALTHFQNALAINPASDAAHAGIIHLFFKTGRWLEGEQQYRKALKADPRATFSRLYYAKILEAFLRKTEALKVLQEAIAINPTFGEAHILAGLLVEEANPNDPAAADHYRKAIAANSNPREAHFLLGRSLFLNSRHAEAIQELLQTIEPMDAKTPTYLRILASAYKRTGQKEKAAALEHRAAAIEKSPQLSASPPIQTQ